MYVHTNDPPGACDLWVDFDRLHVVTVVHCDPHPGNVLVRARAGGQPQLVLLDHGLYRDVEESTRLHYCELWKGIVLADEDAIIRASKGLGVYSPMMEKLYPDRKGGVSHTLLAAMLTQKGWNHVIDPDMSSLELPPPKSEAEKQAEIKALIREDEERVVAAVTNKRLDEISSADTAVGEKPMSLDPAVEVETSEGSGASSAEAAEAYEAELRTNVAEYLPGILEVLQSVDRSVLLLLKTNDCLRSANARLGGRATETYIVTAEYCIRALREAGAPDDSGWGWRTELWRASARISAFRWLQWWREGDAGHAEFGAREIKDRETREKVALALGLPRDAGWATIAKEPGWAKVASQVERADKAS